MQTEDVDKLLLRMWRELGVDKGLAQRITGAQAGTVQRWYGHGQPPTGDRLIRLWHLLEAANGGPLEGAPELSPLTRYLGQLLTFNLVNMETLQSICGLKNSQGVYDMLRGGRDLMAPTKTLEELQLEYGDRLQAARDKLQRALGRDPAAESPPAEPEPAPAPPAAPSETVHQPVPSGPATNRMSDLVAWATAISAVVPTLRHLLSDACSPEDRAKVRELVGSKDLFEMLLMVEKLNSERLKNQAGDR